MTPGAPRLETRETATPAPTAPALFCLGYGYSARALARRLLAKGWGVRGTHRGPPGTGEEGVALLQASRESPPANPAQDLAGATHILVSVPPDEAGDPALDLYGAALEAAPGIVWLGYLSTTGVYGDRGGDWVDETSPLAPTGERGRRRVAAEAAWRALGARSGIAVDLFRLAGIYGPGRSALDTVAGGQAHRVIKPGQVFSRIHVDDIATALDAAIATARPGAERVFNLCDDDPAAPEAVIAYACQLLGVEPPEPVPFEQATLSPMARSFYADNKRVSNARIKRELGVTLAYPSYREGLAALLAESAATAA